MEIKPGRFSRGADNRRVVICGSMKSLDQMSEIGQKLESVGVEVVTPHPDSSAEKRTADAIMDLKRAASRRHMDHIRDAGTAAVLVVNVDRPGVANYVGPNSFAEIGVAFADELPVFLCTACLTATRKN